MTCPREIRSTLLLHNRSTYQYCQQSTYGAAVYQMAILLAKASAKMSAMASMKMSMMVLAILSVKISAMVSGRRRRCYWR